MDKTMIAISIQPLPFSGSNILRPATVRHEPNALILTCRSLQIFIQLDGIPRLRTKKDSRTNYGIHSDSEPAPGSQIVCDCFSSPAKTR